MCGVVGGVAGGASGVRTVNASSSNVGKDQGASQPNAGRIALSQGRRSSWVRVTWWHETICNSKSLRRSVRCSQYGQGNRRGQLLSCVRTWVERLVRLEKVRGQSGHWKQRSRYSGGMVQV